MGIGRKSAVAFFVGLAAVIAVGLNASRRVAPSATVTPSECNVSDPFLSCLASQKGFAVGGLFIWDPH
jgi:hypothetical protein